ncbi:bacterial extracellular solute-binding s, 3 family protein [Delftia acidovorans]|uniref:ABC transporter substrate-binding protein n=1 Tax=Delftia acidovorans TaxID=80866 RepID=UPI0004FF8F61|nr:ABC transporter substrate-binding protein [Delftia acidovorans]KFJ09828.1 bacterial extracellular solute-binding s, 3 family protein [Delftia acidovorans]QQB50402.1 amino acid ABC transporter substrate-binding protein [Delftia acidovorans]
MRPSSTCFGAPPQRRVLAHLAAAAGLLLCLVQWSGCAEAGEVLDRIAATDALRVCIWPDYYGITFRDARTGRLTGIDAELSVELAKDLGVRVQYVDSSFPRLIPDLLESRCDVAMFAVGILAQRQKQQRFTRPYLSSDIYGVTTKSNQTVQSWADIDQPGVQVAVQRGTFMEPVMRETLRHARLVPIEPPQSREKELMAGRVDVFMTDYPYSRRLLDSSDWARLIAPPKPFHVLPYGYATSPADTRWLARLDQFVSDIRRDGRLARAARNNGLTAIVAP